MDVTLDRVILYAHDVERLRDFYVEMFDLSVGEEIAGEWVVLHAGPCEIGLHRVGPAYRTADARVQARRTNVKLVFTVRDDVARRRAELVARGVPMGDITSYGSTGPLCDGTDPEGNVFQISAAARP
jgi:predicted enzyme related to lactoylglutathione lyase